MKAEHQRNLPPRMPVSNNYALKSSASVGRQQNLLAHNSSAGLGSKSVSAYEDQNIEIEEDMPEELGFAGGRHASIEDIDMNVEIAKNMHDDDSNLIY